MLGAVIFVLTRKTSDWKTYSNTRYEFWMDYPSGWVLGELETNNAGRELYSPNNEVYCYVYGFKNALTNDKGNPQSLDEFIDWLVIDQRVGEGFYTEVLERNASLMDGKPAIHLLLEQDGGIKESVYVLGSDTGIGLFCIYFDMEERQRYKSTFNRMTNSIQIDILLGGESPKKLAECSDILAGIFLPLKDRKIFFDDKYTEVTITSRDAWDQSRLPKEVIDLEAKNYECFPIPSEFDGGEAEGDMLPQPEVTMVEWSCEMEYEEWEYIEKENVSRWESDGFACSKQDCWTDDAGEDFVWLCTK